MLDERGSITAEFVAVLPAVVLLLVLALGAMQVAGEHVRLQSAATDAVRMLARGQPGAGAHVTLLVRGATLVRVDRGDTVCAETRAPVRIGTLAAFELTAQSCALSESTP